VWHASVARLKPSGRGLTLTDRWGSGTLHEARRLAMRALQDVGMGESVEMLRPACLHLRRSLSQEEMRFLSAEWLAIPAQDEFSEDGDIESRL
jgi:hypothetical protein